MTANGTWSIGELAERAGVTVKTVRFYSDRGLLPEAHRSTGGHRRYGRDALDRLRLIRSLRALDLPVPDVGRVVESETALEDVVADRLRRVGSRLSALRWQEAALHLLRDCPPAERPDRLRLVGSLPVPPSTDPMARFWRRVLPPRIPSRLLSSILERIVPVAPTDPTPEQALTFARLHALASDLARVPDIRLPAFTAPDADCRPAVLYEGLVEAFSLAEAEVAAGRPPHEGEALDCFVAAYAAFHGAGTPDTPVFRHRLDGLLTRIDFPVLARYWHLTTALSPAMEPTFGRTHGWLHAALGGQVPAAP
ncbi:MerR family transcriptional regulator [Streptomyces sp. TR06-5]|uniref:helix-turn-helix domain-containing protein n=1 Tax=unclassified Streptomyces TaxID=2593676 RepID=UPI0039A25733